MLFIEFHLVVPGLMLVRDSHQLCDRIEQALEKQFNEVSISIHVEPEEYAKTNSTS
jgi:divalent metal cation (Fe/Co/Zn/Cd) transporter